MGKMSHPLVLYKTLLIGGGPERQHNQCYKTTANKREVSQEVREKGATQDVCGPKKVGEGLFWGTTTREKGGPP